MARPKKKVDLKINFKTKTVNVNLDKIKLDLSNVRFQHLFKKMDDAEMNQLILDEPSTTELYEQIKAAGGLYDEPIIDSNYVVLEGNRRIVCLRRLKIEANAGRLPGIKKNAFDLVKCRMIPTNISEIDKHLLLATIHVTGREDWPAFNKAKQIYDLYHTPNISYDQLAKYLGMGKITIIRMTKAYEQTLRYGKEYSDDKIWYRKYTYFDELFKSRALVSFSKVQKNIDKFSTWVHEGKFGDVRDVRHLAKIINDEDAMREFEIHGFKKAFDLLEEKNPTLKSREFKQIKKTIEVIRFFPHNELIKTLKDPNRIKILRQLKEEVDSLIHGIDSLEKNEK